MEQRECTLCRRILPLEDHFPMAGKKDPYRHTRCADCRAADHLMNLWRSKGHPDPTKLERAIHALKFTKMSQEEIRRKLGCSRAAYRNNPSLPEWGYKVIQQADLAYELNISEDRVRRAITRSGVQPIRYANGMNTYISLRDLERVKEAINMPPTELDREGFWLTVEEAAKRLRRDPSVVRKALRGKGGAWGRLLVARHVMTERKGGGLTEQLVFDPFSVEAARAELWGRQRPESIPRGYVSTRQVALILGMKVKSVGNWFKRKDCTVPYWIADTESSVRKNGSGVRYFRMEDLADWLSQRHHPHMRGLARELRKHLPTTLSKTA